MHLNVKQEGRKHSWGKCFPFRNKQNDGGGLNEQKAKSFICENKIRQYSEKPSMYGMAIVPTLFCVGARCNIRATHIFIEQRYDCGFMAPVL